MSASGLPLKGEPLQIVVATNEHLFELDEKCLEDILLKPDVRNKKVAIISVAGAFRKGKSFLLDFFLRYLSAKVSALVLVWLQSLYIYTSLCILNGCNALVVMHIYINYNNTFFFLHPYLKRFLIGYVLEKKIFEILWYPQIVSLAIFTSNKW